jgi:hypothetical protein
MTCEASIGITLHEYEHVRKDARQFVILPGHLVGDIERIVFENDRFAVVASVRERPQTWRGTSTRKGRRGLIDCKDDGRFGRCSSGCFGRLSGDARRVGSLRGTG